MKKYVVSGSLGVTIGLFISLLTSAWFANGAYYPLNPLSDMGRYYAQHFNQGTTMAIAAGIWFVIGLFFQAIDGIFSQEWSLLRMSVTHFILSSVGFSLLAILAGWFPLNMSYFLLFWVIYLIIYVFLYWVNYRHMCQQVEQVNHSLEK